MTDTSQTQGKIRSTFNVTSIWNVIPLLALAVFGTLFLGHIASLDPGQIWDAFAALDVSQWAAACGFTALSFRAIGTYDVLVHTVLNTGQSKRVARDAGVKAIALSQTLGFGAVTSALVRWRCLPRVRPAMIARLSATVSLSFLVGLAAVAGLVIPFSGLLEFSWPFAIVGIAAIAALSALGKLAHRAGWIPSPLRNRTLFALLTATAADTAFAAAALWVLWPDVISFHVLFAAYLIALGAGLMSNTPGGVGAFDLTLLALVPISDDAAAMAALLAFRVIYYALPAGLALLSLLRPIPPTSGKPLCHPEAALAAQTAVIHDHPNAALLTLPCFGAGAVLGNLPTGVSVFDLRGPHPQALYKCDAQQAAEARKAGWAVLRCARDAVIDLDRWTTDGPKRRQLRRALRSFENSGLHIKEVRQFRDLRPVAQAWSADHGGERGLSMGQFCETYLRHQRVFVAFDGTKPVAFVSFHHSNDDWTLDLMRHVADIAPGTMHALVCAGLNAAQNNSVLRVSLAAVPAPEPHLPYAQQAIENAHGLIRFKNSFGPTWQPRYLCARTAFHLVLTMVTLAHGILRPRALGDPHVAHPDHEDYSFAPAHGPCERISH